MIFHLSYRRHFDIKFALPVYMRIYRSVILNFRYYARIFINILCFFSAGIFISREALFKTYLINSFIITPQKILKLKSVYFFKKGSLSAILFSYLKFIWLLPPFFSKSVLCLLALIRRIKI